jgi:hypothetical protein
LIIVINGYEDSSKERYNDNCIIFRQQNQTIQRGTEDMTTNLKNPSVNESTEILEMVTIDDDIYQDVIGYYAYGHWDSQSFAIAINQEYDLASDERPVWVRDVKHSYMTTMNIDSADQLIFSQLPRHGYEAATYVEI